MRRLTDESLVSWLRERADHDYQTGLDASGWPASTWILNGIYERSDLPTDLSHDELFHLRLARGEIEPTVIGNVDLDNVGVLTGGRAGWTERPGPEWTRVRWTELADRLGIVLGQHEVPPCFRWFPFKSWPANVEPPDEGSLDAVSLEGLLRCLTDHEADATDTRCFAFYAPVPSWEYDVPTVFEGPLRAIPTLIDPSQNRHGTPSNVWPHDRSWLVYTDWDLWATKVSGPESLIQRLRSDPDLETFDWVWPVKA